MEEVFNGIEDPSWHLLLNLGEAELIKAIRRSCEIKASIVAEDEREAGKRMLLNFGHTFAHALEALTSYSVLLHGEAVAIGMVMAADLSARQGLIDFSEARKIKQAIAALGLGVVPPEFPAAQLESAMGMDKKVVDGTLRLVLVRGIGQAFITEDIDVVALNATLSAGAALCDG